MVAERLSGRAQRASSRARRVILPSLVEDSDSEEEEEMDDASRKRHPVTSAGNKAISKSGYTCRGRVKQKAQKRVELVRVGERR